MAYGDAYYYGVGIGGQIHEHHTPGGSHSVPRFGPLMNDVELLCPKRTKQNGKALLTWIGPPTSLWTILSFWDDSAVEGGYSVFAIEGKFSFAVTCEIAEQAFPWVFRRIGNRFQVEEFNANHVPVEA
jgi:hypothetical protein